MPKLYPDIRWFIKAPNKLAGSGLKHGEGFTRTITHQNYDIDYNNINDIIRVLKDLNFDKLIILEDFQYIKEETLRDMSFHLKHLLEEGFRLIIVGIWVDEARMITHNGDLSGRVNYVNCSDWTDDEIRQVILKGQTFLNITWAPDIIDLIVKSSIQNIGIAQRICYEVCYQIGIRETLLANLTIDNFTVVHEVIAKINQMETSRLDGNFERFAKGLSDSKLKLYSWILKYILSSPIDDLRKGLHKRDLSNWLRLNHPKKNTLQQTSIDNALGRIVHLQTERSIYPPLFDYSSQKIMVVDDYLLLYLSQLSDPEKLEMATRYGS